MEWVGLGGNFSVLPSEHISDRYIETLVKLRVPKKESKRSTEGGLGHVPFRIWIPAYVKVIRWQKEGSFRLVLRFFMFIPNLTSL